MNRKINQLFLRNDGSKKIIIIIAIAIVIIILAVIYIASGGDKTEEEKYYEDTKKIIEEQQNLSEEEQISQEERIASIESAVNEVMAGTNNRGSVYLKNSLVDRRLSEREEYLADIEFNADEWEWTRDITLEEKDMKEYSVIKKKCANLYKSLYGTENKVYYVRCRAFHDNDEYNPIFSALIQREAADEVDWRQDLDTLANDVLPKVWNAWINEYSMYD